MPCISLLHYNTFSLTVSLVGFCEAGYRETGVCETGDGTFHAFEAIVFVHGRFLVQSMWMRMLVVDPRRLPWFRSKPRVPPADAYALELHIVSTYAKIQETYAIKKKYNSSYPELLARMYPYASPIVTVG